MDSRGHVRRAALLAVATAAVALLGATSAVGQVVQTPKNGCESPDSYSGSLTSPSFTTGIEPQLTFEAWFEVEGIAPSSRDVTYIEAGVLDGDTGIRNWTPIGQLPPNTAVVGFRFDQGFSNNGAGQTPTFHSYPAGDVQLDTLPSSQADVQLRFRFDTGDGLYNGFRGVGIDNVSISNSNPPITQGFESAFGFGSNDWTADLQAGAGAPFWQPIQNGNGIVVRNPLINPDLVTLPDAGALPSTASGTGYAWFGDMATGTFCGPDFANRFVPGQTGPTGSTGSTGQTGTTTPRIGLAQRRTLADLPAPVLGKVANVEPVKGTVLVAIPKGKAAARGTSVGEAIASQKGLKFVPLEEARQIPVGSFLDTRKGTVRLQAAATGAAKPYLGSFSAGLFQMRQSRKRSAKGLTDLVLKGGKLRSCAAQRKGKRGKRASAALSRKRLRRLRGKGKGRFRTRGRYSAATVRGTKWTVTDRCDGTLTQVSRGKVAVRDFRRKKTILLRAGKRYLAGATR